LISLQIIGSIALFMIGFHAVTDILLAAVSPWFKHRIISLGKGAGPRGMLIGLLSAGATSSNASGTIFLITMVDSRLTQLRHVPWILLGLNLGAASANWLIAAAGFSLNLSIYGLALLAVSLPFRFSSWLSRYDLGEVLTGCGCMLLGIELLQGSYLLIPSDPVLIYWMQFISEHPAGAAGFLLLGAACAWSTRSSVSAAVLSMSLAARGWIPFQLSAAMMLGSSLALAFVGFSAAKLLGRDARITAWLNLVIHIGAVIWASALFGRLIQLTDLLLPGQRFIPEDIPLRIAAFYTLVHLINPLVIMPLFTLTGSLIRKSALGAHFLRTPAAESAGLRQLPKTLPDALDANMILMQSGLGQMAEWASQMLMLVMNTSQEPGGGEHALEKVHHVQHRLAGMQQDISRAGNVSIRQSCSRLQAKTIHHQLLVAEELADIGEACGKCMNLLVKSWSKGYRFHEASTDELFSFISQVLDFLRYVSDYLADRIRQPDLQLADTMEEAIDTMRDALREKARTFLEEHTGAQVKGEFAFIEIIKYLEHIGDSCLSISGTIPKIMKYPR